MGNYLLSKKAENELAVIYEYSLIHFGWEQADSYLLELKTSLGYLADNPRMGRINDYLKAGVRRHECQRHVIYYQEMKKDADILVIRILGASQDPAKHLK